MYLKAKGFSCIGLSTTNNITLYEDTTSGNLDAGQDQAQTSIKSYVNRIGKTGYVEMEARWANQGFVRFKTTHTAGE